MVIAVFKRGLAALLCMCAFISLNADITVQTFEDLNNNGIQDPGEELITGLTVSGTDAKDNTYAFLDDGMGTHTLPSAIIISRIRVTVTGYAPGLEQAPAGPTSVFYVSDNSTTMVPVSTGPNFDVQATRIMIPCYEPGPAVDNTGPAFVSFPYEVDGVAASKGGNAADPQVDATLEEIGSTWGVAYQFNQKRAFASSVLKRHVGLGPMGLGGLYVIDYDDMGVATVMPHSLHGITPSVGPALDFGNVQREIVNGDVDYTMPYALTTQAGVATYDVDAYDKIGKVGYGDIDVTYDQRKLFMVNLHQRSLVEMDVSGTEDIAPTGSKLKNYLIDNLPGLPNLNFRYRMCINAGGNLNGSGSEAYTDPNGVAWDKNKYNAGGASSYNGFSAGNTLNDAEKTSDAQLYQTFRRGMSFAYNIPIPVEEMYQVTLHFAEPMSTAVVGSRIFDIKAEGTNIRTDFDVVDEAGGPRMATTISFTVDGKGDFLELEFVGKTGEALVSGVEVQGQSVMNSGVLRPWALNFEGEKGYLGVISDASISKSREHIFAYVLSFDPENVQAGFTEELSFPLAYPRERTANAHLSNPQPLRNAEWQGWVSDFQSTEINTKDEVLSVSGTLLCTYPQPILSDIDFTDDGGFAVTVMDRWAHQTGYENYPPDPGDSTLLTSYASGDILRVFNNNGAFELEAMNNDPGITYRDDDGPSYEGEFFYDDVYNTSISHHGEISTGGLAVLPRSNEVVNTTFNPVVVTSPSTDYELGGIYSQGIQFYDQTEGGLERGYLFVDQYVSGKANGLGDLEFAALINGGEMGNYVWCDGNGNGIQDADEYGIDGIVVQLLDKENSNAPVESVITSGGGEFIFTGLMANHQYLVRIPLQQLIDMGFSGMVPPPFQGMDTLVDSNGDPDMIPGYTSTMFTTGAIGTNDHSIDFAFLGPHFDDCVLAKCEEAAGMGTATYSQGEIDSCLLGDDVGAYDIMYYGNLVNDTLMDPIASFPLTVMDDSCIYARINILNEPECFTIAKVTMNVQSAGSNDIQYERLACMMDMVDLTMELEDFGLNFVPGTEMFYSDMVGGTPIMDPANYVINGMTTVYWDAELGSGPMCPIAGQITYNIYAPSIVEAGNDTMVCGLDCADLTTLGASFNPNGSGAVQAQWTTAGDGSFIPNSNYADARFYCPGPADTMAGSAVLTLTVLDDPCMPVSDMVTINIIPDDPEFLPGRGDTIDCTHPFANNPIADLDTFPGCRAVVHCGSDTLEGDVTGYEKLAGDCINFSGAIKRTLIFRYMGQEIFCMDTIFIAPLPDSLVCPAEKDSLYCHLDYLRDENGNPSPLETGYPILVNDMGDTLELWPQPAAACDILINYKDYPIGGECPETIKREWYIKNGCTGEFDTCTQWLMIFDTVPPTMDVDTTLIIPSESHDCYANVYAPPVEVTDTCAGVKVVKARINGYGTVVMSYNDETGLWESHEKIRLPVSQVDLVNMGYLGTYTLVYEAFDHCHNQSIDSLEIIVADKTPPVMVCDKGINVTVNDTIVWVDAETMNEGSNDNCDIALLLARRVDWATACGVDLCDDVDFFCETEHHDSLWISRLETDKHINPVEAHYAKQLDWITGDAEACNVFLFYGWLYDLIKVATLECVDHPYPVDEHYLDDLIRSLTCEITPETLDSIFPNLINVDFFLQAIEDIIKLLIKRPNLDVFGVIQAIADMGPQIGGGWSPQVPFCCEDACQDIKVELLAMDYWCNWSKCWTTVRVEDKTPPEVVRDLYDVSVTCASYKTYYEPAVELALQGDFDSLQSVLGFYDQVQFDQYGNVAAPTTFDLYEISCDSNLVTKDSLYYDEHLGYIWKTYSYYRAAYDTTVVQAYNGQIADNCGLVRIEEKPWVNIDHCGNGYIKRVFKFVGQCSTEGTVHTADTITRTQTIWITSDCEITPAMFEVPKDTIIYACGIEYAADGSGNAAGAASPEYTGMGRYTFDNDCRLVGVGYYDKVFKVVGGDEACYKIIRTWCFADWCDVGDTPQNGSWWHNPKYKGKYLSYEQKIIMLDSTPPVCLITGVPEVVQAAGCEYDLQTAVQVVDECGALYYSWKVVNTDTDDIVADGQGELIAEQQGRFLVEAPGLPSGSYSLKVIVTDECQNESICDVPFVVEPAKTPGPVCITSLTVELNPMDLDNDGVADTAMAEVDAIAFNISSTAACGSDEADLEYRIDDGEGEAALPPASATTLYLGCEDVGNQQVRMYVLDPSGTWDYCDVLLTVQSNMGGCNETNGSDPAKLTSSNANPVVRTDVVRNDGSGNIQVAGDASSGNSISWGQTAELRQNRPNPWKSSTIIGFDLPEATQVYLSVYDLTGRVIKMQDGYYSKGYHEWHLDQGDMNSNGVFYYKLQTANDTAVKRMIKLD